MRAKVRSVSNAAIGISEGPVARALWDEAAIDRRIMEAVQRTLRQAMDKATAPAEAAVYLLYYHGQHAAYRSLDPDEPIYVGSTRNMERRLREHRTSLHQARNLALADFTIAVVPTFSVESAAYAELRLIRHFGPLWNTEAYSGFGSKHQGRLRAAGQRPTTWDSLHPGRSWVFQSSRRQ